MPAAAPLLQPRDAPHPLTGLTPTPCPPATPPQVAAVKAALKARLAEERAQGGLLRFRNPALEQRYQAWYSAGQVRARCPVSSERLLAAARGAAAVPPGWAGWAHAPARIDTTPPLSARHRPAQRRAARPPPPPGRSCPSTSPSC